MQTAEALGTVTTITTIILTTMLTGALSQVWGLINGLQLIVHLPLIAKAVFPEFTDFMFALIIQVAQFDLIDSETYIFRGIFDMEIPDGYPSYHDLSLEKITYTSTYTILNLGTLYLIFIIFVIEAILLTLLKPLVKICPSRLMRWHRTLSVALYWNSFLRLILEASLDLAIASFNNIHIVKKVIDDGITDWYTPTLPFFWLNYITTGGAVFVLVIGPIFACCHYLRRFDQWENDHFENSLGSVIEGLRKDSRMAIFYPVFFMFRRSTFAIQAIFFSEYFESQIHVQITLTLIQIAYLLVFRPFEDRLVQNLEIMNESFTLLLMYHVLVLNTDWVPYDLPRRTAGHSLIIFILINVVINFYFLFRTIAKDKKEKLFR